MPLPNGQKLVSMGQSASECLIFLIKEKTPLQRLNGCGQGGGILPP